MTIYKFEKDIPCKNLIRDGLETFLHLLEKQFNLVITNII